MTNSLSSDRARAPASSTSGAVPECLSRATILHPARALGNTIYVVFSNLLGEADGRRFCGGSAIYDPEGQMLAGAGQSEEGLAIADVDPAALADVRESSPMLREVRALP